MDIITRDTLSLYADDIAKIARKLCKRNPQFAEEELQQVAFLRLCHLVRGKVTERVYIPDSSAPIRDVTRIDWKPKVVDSARGYIYKVALHAMLDWVGRDKKNRVHLSLDSLNYGSIEALESSMERAADTGRYCSIHRAKNLPVCESSKYDVKLDRLGDYPNLYARVKHLTQRQQEALCLVFGLEDKQGYLANDETTIEGYCLSRNVTYRSIMKNKDLALKRLGETIL